MYRFLPVALFAVLPLVGCANQSSDSSKPGAVAKSDQKVEKSEEQEIQESLAELSPADRKLAEAQKYCANEDTSRLGSMGAPYKLMLKEKPVFLCCKGCEKDVLREPDKYLAKVEELKKKAAAEVQK